ncbi:MAG: hypothetical protein K6A35_03805 [bacterium]|nr:hypothetical protein [bacterium]
MSESVRVESVYVTISRWLDSPTTQRVFSEGAESDQFASLTSTAAGNVLVESIPVVKLGKIICKPK